MLTVFQCITMEGWTDVLYSVSIGLQARYFIYASSRNARHLVVT
jgi:hypothetical protein